MTCAIAVAESNMPISRICNFIFIIQDCLACGNYQLLHDRAKFLKSINQYFSTDLFSFAIYKYNGVITFLQLNALGKVRYTVIENTG